MRPSYGIGYQPIGDLADFVDPFGIRKIPGKIANKVDHYVNAKAQTAANLAEKHVEAGVNKAIQSAGKEALAFVAGGCIIGAVWGGLTFYRRSKSHR
jgi:hypothetical protein